MVTLEAGISRRKALRAVGARWGPGAGDEEVAPICQVWPRANSTGCVSRISAVVGPVDDPRTAELLGVARRSTAPGAVVVRGDEGSDHPLLAGRPLVGGSPAAYVCRRFVCDAPTTSPEELAAALSPATP